MMDEKHDNNTDDSRRVTIGQKNALDELHRMEGVGRRSFDVLQNVLAVIGLLVVLGFQIEKMLDVYNRTSSIYRISVLSLSIFVIIVLIFWFFVLLFFSIVSAIRYIMEPYNGGLSKKIVSMIIMYTLLLTTVSVIETGISRIFGYNFVDKVFNYILYLIK